MRFALLITFTVTFALGTNAQYVPPDFYGEAYSKSLVFMKNRGQLIDHFGDPADGVKYYTQSSMPRMYMSETGKMSIAWYSNDFDFTDPDEYRRVDVAPVGERAQLVDPIHYDEKDYHYNYYFPHCGAVENVKGYSRVIYQNVYPNIDIHHYGTVSGTKMSIVCRAGSNPQDVHLQFTGQDSLRVDLMGNLKIFLNNKWVALREAVAYQVGSGNAIIPVNWTANYLPQGSTGVVTFHFDAYDASKPLILQIGAPPFGGGSYAETGVCWSTYFGGSGDDYVVDIERTSGGGTYVTGNSTSDFNLFPGLGLTYLPGGMFAFASYFDVSENLLWSTVYGGGTNESCRSNAMAIRDTQTLNNVYFCGNTNSTGIVTINPLNEHLESAPSGPIPSTGFIAKLQPFDGFLLWATYINAAQNPLGSELMVDDIEVLDNGRLVIAGLTTDAVAGNDPGETFPPGAGGFAPVLATALNGFAMMFTTSDRVTWYSYFMPGALFQDGGQPVEAIDLAEGYGKFVVTCVTADQNMLMAANFNEYAHGEGEYVVFEFGPNAELNWSTYFGGPDTETYFYDLGLPQIGFFSSFNATSIDPATGDIVIAGSTMGGLSTIQGNGWAQLTNTASGSSSFIARFDGITHLPEWVTYLHGALGSWTLVYGTQFDNAGNLGVVAYSRNGGHPVQSYNGFYYAPSVIGNTIGGVPANDNDGYVLYLDGNQNIIYASYFGGAAGGADEAPIAVEFTADGIMLAGYTSKDVSAGLFGSYFPLDDGGGTKYFPANGWGGSDKDGFISRICPEMVTGIESSQSDKGTVRATLEGLQFSAPYTGELLFYDVIGRVVLSNRVQGVSEFPLPSNIAAGHYVCCGSFGAVKLVKR